MPTGSLCSINNAAVMHAAHLATAMADISIRKSFSMPIAKARKAAQTVAEELASQYNIAYTWEGDVLTFKKTGLSGELRLAPKKIEIDINLGLVMRIFKEPMRAEIEKNIDTIFT